MDFIVTERDTKPVIKKENVYVTGHMKDERYINAIVQEVLEAWDCKVYVAARPQYNRDLEDCYMFLNGVNLVILVVSQSFLLEDNPAKDVEFQYMKEKNIPVLPILVEEGLEHLFNSVCGDLQLLHRNRTKEYTFKLQEYFSRLFGDDELHLEIQKAFVCKMFLSYRKKDREYALQLMRLIHQFDFAQDIAIWFDDFLTLGEDYDEEIDDHLNNSDFFVLAVTPSILEDDNYVMKTEYPRALELHKKIVPIELVPTDRLALQTKYPQMPECIKISEIQTLEKMLMEVRQEFKWEAYSNSPEKAYLLGQAYLKGINVEINREFGISLLTRAAEADYLKAVEQLARMNYTGEGVERNLFKAQYWLEKEVELTQQHFDREGGVEWGQALALALLHLSDCYINLGKQTAAKPILARLGEISSWLWNQGILGTGTNPGNVWLRLGFICAEEGDYKEAVRYCSNAEEILEMMYKHGESIQSARSYALVLAKLGELYIQLYGEEGNVSCLYQAIEYLEKAKIPQHKLIEAYMQKDAVPNLISIYMNLGRAYGEMVTMQQNPDEMLVCSEKARSHFWKVYQQRDCLQEERLNCLYSYAIYTNMTGSLEESQGDMAAARGFYTEAYNVHRDMCQTRGYNEDWYGLATVGINLAVAGMDIPDKELLMEAYSILEMLCQKNPENEQYRMYKEGTKRRLDVWPIRIG